MSANATAVLVALQTQLAAMSGVLPTQFENQKFDIPETPYQRVNLMLADPANPEMGRFFQEQGYFQITLMYPIGPGAGAALAMAENLRNWFYRGLSLAASGVTVTINRTPTIAPSAIDGNRYSVPIKIRFIANNAL